MEKDIQVAIVTCQSRVGNTNANLQTMKIWTQTAAAKNSDIVCFPELCITGYHARESIVNEALSIDSPAVENVFQMARDNNIAIIASLAERVESGHIYSTAFVCDQTGLLGTYRKVHLGPPEKKIFTQAENIGSLFDVKGFRFGIQLCYDAHFPELSTHMAALGADAIFFPHASPGTNASEKKDSWMRHLPARAFDNGLFVIAVNPVGDNGLGVHFPGTAIALSPAGKILASHTSDRETMTVVNLSRELIGSVRTHKMRYFFSNRRPELYHNNKE